MDRRIRVMIGDGNTATRESLANCIAGQSDMEVIGFAGNGDEALGLIVQLKPDIAILEALLPVKDGLGVLEDLATMNHKETACIMVSGMDTDSIINRALDLGAKYYMIKPYQDDILLRRIRQVYESVQGQRQMRSGMPKLSNISTSSQRLSNQEMRVSRLLNRLGITASIKGYHYLRAAILMALNDPETMIGITKGMYPDIAKKFKTSSSKVERAIRHAIESAWKRGGGAVYNELIGYHPGSKPTNGQFIAAVAEYIRMYPDEKNAS